MKLKKYSLLLLAAGFLATGCKKELEQFDPESIGEENAFQTIQHVELGVNGAYDRMVTYVNDIRKNAYSSDEAKPGPQNGGSGLLTYRLQWGSDATTGGDVTGGYYGNYNLIDQVNRVLPKIGLVSGGTDERKNILRGSLLAMRAIAHFNLLQSFCGPYDPNGLGVAVMTESNPNAQPARQTMGEVMTQILADLAEAKAAFPDATAGNFSDTVMNKLNIEAFEARIALYRRDYDAAITHATNVIATDIRPLATDANYVSMWSDITPGEVLFRVRTGSDPRTAGVLGLLFASASDGITFSPSDKLRSQFISEDIRETAFFAQNGTGDWYIKKHWMSDRGPRFVDVKIIRTSEMFLIRAEAYASKVAPDVTAGTNDLNALRASRIAGYVDQSFPSADALKNAVVNERYKELCFEGHRFYDLKRLGLDLERAASDASPEWQFLRWGTTEDFRFVYPIPRDATNANPNTAQNPGY